MIRARWGWKQASLETAVTVMQQRTTGRQVTLVSVIHIGLPDYYAAIADLIHAHEQRGGVVLYEGLGSLSESEVSQLSGQERTIYRMLAPLHDLYRALARSLGLVFQGEALHYDREHWINADLSLRELVRRWAESGAPLLPLGTARSAEVDVPGGRFGRGAAGLMLLQTPLLLKGFGGLSRRVPALGKLRELLLSDRNRAALDALEAADANRDALLLYGAGHMPGIVEGLERRSYSLLTQWWLTAFVQALPWTHLAGATVHDPRRA